MLYKVKIQKKSIDDYAKFRGKSYINKLKKRATQFKGVRFNMVNSTPVGGGVAEMLKSLIPLLNSLGISVSWYCIKENKRFFSITKQIHNALQGKKNHFSEADKNYYLNINKKIAKSINDIKADMWLIHDPQPAGIIEYVQKKVPFIARVHIDTTSPDLSVWDFFAKFWSKYDGTIFTLREFVHKGLNPKRKYFVFPAIDPLAQKNQSMNIKSARVVLQKFGIDTNMPIISQVSRFDPWKDPIGVIDAYRLAKKEIKNLQLILVGFIVAKDDPEAVDILRKVKEYAKGDRDIFLFYNLKQIGDYTNNVFVKAVQTASDIVLQKSIKEGFGLTVTEAMWKGKAVIGGNVGGIKKQITDKKNGYLVNSPKEASDVVIKLLNNPEKRKEIGKKAKESVLEKFLIMRLINDYLKILEDNLK